MAYPCSVLSRVQPFASTAATSLSRTEQARSPDAGATSRRNLPLPPNIARSVERLFWIAPRVLATFLCSPTSISGATSTRLSTSPALAPSAASGPSGFCDSPTLGCGGASTLAGAGADTRRTLGVGSEYVFSSRPGSDGKSGVGGYLPTSFFIQWPARGIGSPRRLARLASAEALAPSSMALGVIGVDQMRPKSSRRLRVVIDYASLSNSAVLSSDMASYLHAQILIRREGLNSQTSIPYVAQIE